MPTYTMRSSGSWNKRILSSVRVISALASLILRTRASRTDSFWKAIIRTALVLAKPPHPRWGSVPA